MDGIGTSRPLHTPDREFERIQIDWERLGYMPEEAKTFGWLIATLVAVVVFITLCALALPRLETSLTFIPILAISVIAGAISGFLVRKRAPSR
jgi:hypothetical protein